MSDIKEYLERCSTLTENWLREHLKEYAPQSKELTEAMCYSVFAGGKRLRPALMYASFGIFSDDADIVTPYAASIEVLHTYSLIHDDLPSMDNDDLRRGKPTNHKVFGEAEAILAGDALLTKAFEFIADSKNTPKISDNIRIKAVHALTLAAGDRGMVAGQFADIKAENHKADTETVDFIHLNKTAALIKYSVSIGGILAGRCHSDMVKLEQFGCNLGLAFQIADDVLDVTSSTDVLGKSVGSDTENGKATYPALYGVDKSVKKAQALISEACECIAGYGDRANTLIDIANFVMERKS